MDCNPELVQFLGYNSLAEFNSCVHGLEDVLVTDESRYGVHLIEVCVLTTFAKGHSIYPLLRLETLRSLQQ